MILDIEATFENGVFVPAKKPPIPENQRVRLLVEAIPAKNVGGPPIVWRPDRIRIDPALAEEIARSAEFQPEES